MTGQAASCTIFSISWSACRELSPSPTRATSGRSLAVTAPTSATSIPRAMTSCPSAATIGATRASRSLRSLAIAWEKTELEIGEINDAKDAVVVRIRRPLRWRASGMETEVEYSAAYLLDGGKITRYHE
jgi:hypothetical protein